MYVVVIVMVTKWSSELKTDTYTDKLVLCNQHVIFNDFSVTAGMVGKDRCNVMIKNILKIPYVFILISLKFKMYFPKFLFSLKV